MASFFEYLVTISVAMEQPLSLSDVDRDLINGYLLYLANSRLSTPSQKCKYDKTKAVLRALGKRSQIRVVAVGDDATFPTDPFPGAGRKVKGRAPLTRTERKKFAVALNEALAPMFANGATLTSELVSYAALAVALYTGRNTTPILEMSPSCLRPHPKEDTMFLVLYKRRGHNYNKVALRNDLKTWQMVEGTSTVRWNMVTLIRRVVELSEPLRERAHPSIKDRLWLFETSRSWANRVVGEVAALAGPTLMRNVTAFVARAGLVDAGGQPLRINISRLRKTFVNRMNELLNGDLAATAAAAGSSPSVVGNHYLRPGEDAQKNWRFMGEILVRELLSDAIGKSEKTPVGRCSDANAGEYAPKKADGSVCTSFLNCLRCSNYVVTGDDLYRLFSFYWRILEERTRIEKRRWDKQFAHIVRLIDRDVIEAGLKRRVFKRRQVDEARERARVDPHPFWRTAGIIEVMAA